MAEFTGERVIPGQVELDLWNEHFSRYAFAARLSRRKRVLDAGCGTGYGSAELARAASLVVGLDIAGEALAYAGEHYPLPNLRLLRASCDALPFQDGAFDLVVSFEVIEHLKDWRAFLLEIRRLLAPGGQCVLSTPNRDCYEVSRGAAGANPYHEHEFTFEEFREELGAVFPHISLFLQNHSEGFVFQPARSFSPAEARVDCGAGRPEDSHFFVAVCALAPQTGAPTFLYLPKAANILREREEQIAKLVQTVSAVSEERDKLLEMFRRQIEELEQRNRWAATLNHELEQAGARITELQEELQAQARGYKAKVADLEEDIRQKTEWAVETERRLSQELSNKCLELARCVDLLHEAEKTLEERTQWAIDLESQIRDLKGRLGLVRGSRWVKLGNALGVGPRLRNE